MNDCAQLQQIYTVLEFLVFLVRKTPRQTPDKIYTVLEFLVFLVRKTLKKNPKKIFVPKYRISTAVMIVNPVRSPKVPPIAESILTKVVALSFMILVKTKSLKFNLIYLSPSLSILILFSKNITYYFKMKLYALEGLS